MALIRANIGFSTGRVNGHLTGTGELSARSYYRPMLSDVLNRIEQRLTAVKLTANAASKKARLSEDAIRNMRRAAEKDDRQGVSTSTIIALAPVLKTTVGWLLEGGPEPDGPVLVPIIGRAGADPEGRILYAEGDETGDMAPLPPGGTDQARGVRIVGHSMRGVADDGSLIYFEDQRAPPTPDMIGYPCVVETEDGLVLIKRLLKGSSKGLYDLESLNGPTMSDVRLKWAAEITAVIPPRQARRIIKGLGEAEVA